MCNGCKNLLDRVTQRARILDRTEQNRTRLPYRYFYNKVTGQGKYQKKAATPSDIAEAAHLEATRGGIDTSTITNATDYLELYQSSNLPLTRGGTTTSLEKSVDWDYIATNLESKGLGSGGANLRLARLMGIYTTDSQIKANIPSCDRSQFSQVRYKFLLTAPFNVSNRCCSVFKKNISHAYNRKNDMHPILASMASESRLRTQKWLENGCNGFDLKEPVANVMAFWTDNDVLLYIKEHNLKMASVYGDIVVDYRSQNQVSGQISFADMGLFDAKPVLTTTGCLRTGCVGCGFGILLEKRPNRLELIDQVSNPKLRDFILRGGAFDEDGLWKPDNRGLGFWFVHRYIALALGKDLYIPEYERYEREFGNELTAYYLERAKEIAKQK